MPKFFATRARLWSTLGLIDLHVGRLRLLDLQHLVDQLAQHLQPQAIVVLALQA
ncbi:MAG: hypothetical protein P0Y64_15505 [Candidatus Sphingomonas colombiensis]|nr:hypothetical protein [Sphingomonas sp.]WEK42752.1 MAG: hypothetical protein P0Y64_15505 [Sphingomonas sp.]